MSHIASTQEQPMALGGMKQRRNKSKILAFGLVIVFVIVAAIFSIAYFSVESSKKDLESALEKDLDNVVSSRVNEIKLWVRSSVLTPAERFAGFADLKYFAAEMDALSVKVPVMAPPSGKSQVLGENDLEYLNSQLQDITLLNDFTYGGLVNRSGDIYISTDKNVLTLNKDQLPFAKRVFDEDKVVFSNVYKLNKRNLMLDVYVPVRSMPDKDGNSKVTAVLMFAKPVSAKLNEIFNTGYAGSGINGYLLQKTADGQENVMFGNNEVLPVMQPVALDANGKLPFGDRTSVKDGKRVYSYGSKTADLDWMVVWEQDYDLARKNLNSKVKNMYGMAGMVALVLLLLVAGFWWWMVGFERSQMLAQSQEFYKVIDEQKRLLDSINSTISDPISLTDANGIYRYVNRAFAQAVGRDSNAIPGLDTAAVFGFDTGKRLNSTDQHVLMSGEGVTTNEIIWLQSRKHYFQISKTPLRESGTRTPRGIVAVFRDITEVVETEERSHRMVQQTIDALVRAIERADPFLGGHSRIMGEVARLISSSLDLDDKEIATISTAATLSQIGKMFVPREVLTKPGILTDDEKKIMEQHVEHTRNILQNIEFDLPVVDAISQMNERIDGNGYPAGLQGDEISIYGRVLAVANAFTAMARPRSYRPAMPAETALATLQSATDSYDQHVVEILRQVLQTPDGQRIIEMAAESDAE